MMNRGTAVTSSASHAQLGGYVPDTFITTNQLGKVVAIYLYFTHILMV